MAIVSELTGLTQSLLDDLFELRYPWAKNGTVDFESLVQWQGPLPSEIENALFELTWPTVCKLTTLKSTTTQPELVEECLLVLGHSSEPNFLPRGVALVMLLDQCPRMFYAQSTNARWVSGFFDPLVQDIISHLLEHGFESWAVLGYDLEGYMVITSLILSAADHSESMGRHNTLREIHKHRRAVLEEASGHSDPFAILAAARDKHDTLAFSRFMRSEKPKIRNVYDFLYLRMAIVDIHYPIIEKFGRYPWRNGNIGRASTEEELQFLEDSDHFGELDQDVQEQINADIAAGRWTPFS